MEVPRTPGPILPTPQGYLAAKVLDDGRLCCLMPLTFGRARITVGTDWIGYDLGY